jgi:hypothetical protein
LNRPEFISLATNEMHDLVNEIYEALMDNEKKTAMAKMNTLTYLVRDLKQTFSNEN